MTYTLVALFLSTGAAYVERTGLTLEKCAGLAAMVRQQILPDLEQKIGRVQMHCVPEFKGRSQDV
jgi:hypothetical protein